MTDKERLYNETVQALQIIRDLCVDYDGFDTVEGLKSLIDDIRKIAEETMKEIVK